MKYIIRVYKVVFRFFPHAKWQIPLIVVCPMDDWVECGTYPALSGAAEGCKCT